MIDDILFFWIIAGITFLVFVVIILFDRYFDGWKVVAQIYKQRRIRKSTRRKTKK